MMLFAVSDVVWQALIAACLAIVLAVLKYSSEKRADERAKKAEVKVEEVKTTLETNTTHTDEKLADIAKQASDTHSLVNSGSLVQLKINERSARRLAGITKDPEDIKDLEAAERMVREHEAKQAKVDENRSAPEKQAAQWTVDHTRTHL